MSSKYRRGGLGRGLGALIPTAPDSAESDQPRDVASYPPMPTYDPAGADVSPEYRPPEYQPDDQPPEAAQPQPAETPAEPVAELADEDDLVAVTGVRLVEVAVPAVRPNPKQPRQVFDEDALAELTYSIREFGVLQPIVVREADDGGYELVMGERRLRAAAAAGLDTIPAIVRITGDDEMLRNALLENVHRAQLNPLEEAAAYQQLLEEFGATHDELATRIGRSRPQVSNTIRLLNLPIPVQRRVAAGVISAGHARALLSVEDSDLQEELAGRIVAEGLSVRAIEELVALHGAGHATAQRTRKAAPRITAPALSELADRLSDAFDTRVKVELGRSKGKITVEFATIDDLERIVSVMSGRLAMSGPPPGGPRPTDTDAPAYLPADPPSDPADPGYAGWGSEHVPDLGAWNDVRYDPNDDDVPKADDPNGDPEDDPEEPPRESNEP